MSDTVSDDEARYVVLAGDHTDDDPQVLDSLVQQQSEPPSPAQRPRVTEEPKRTPRPATRLLTQTIAIHTSGGAVLLAPADPDREAMSLRIATTTDPAVILRIADDSGKVMSDMGSLVVFPGDSLVNVFSGHTGPVWANAIRSDGDPTDGVVRVSLVAVTK